MIVFAPTKTMKQVECLNEGTSPVFLENSEKLRSILKTYQKEDLASLMKIKNKTLDLTYDYFSKVYPETMAIHAYSGIAFKQIEHFDYQYLANNALIFSGLYGVLRPTDRIKPYRLDFTMPKITEDNLYKFWQEDVSDYINTINPAYILNLASEEFTKLIRKTISIDTTIIDLEFNEKVNSTNLKKIRGQIFNYCIKHQIYDYEELECVSFDFFEVAKLDNNKLHISIK